MIITITVIRCVIVIVIIMSIHDNHTDRREGAG